MSDNRVHEMNDRLFRFTSHHYVESTLERFNRAHGRMRPTGDEQRHASTQPFHQAVRVPHPPREQRHPHDVGVERLDLGDDPLVIVCEVSRRRVDDAHFASVPNERGRHVLLPEQRSAKLLGRARVDEENARWARRRLAHTMKCGPASTMLPPTTGPTGTYGGENAGIGPLPSTMVTSCVGNQSATALENPVAMDVKSSSE